jgi:hypothetical protein
MNKKGLFFLISVILLTGMVRSSPAGICWWKGGSAVDRYWNNPSNWWNAVPTSADTANLNKCQGIQPEIDANCVGGNAAVCSILYLPSWRDDGTSGSYLYMTGGILTVGNNFEMGRWGGVDNGSTVPFDIGFFNISDGNVTVGGNLSVAISGRATINMTGGNIAISGNLKVPDGTTLGGAGIGTGRINLTNGTITADNLSMNANGSIDINEGVLILNGNDKTTVNGYIDNGWITPNDVSKQVIADYNAATGKTIVSVGEPLNYFEVIDNFESYTDSNDLRLVWFDGSDGNNNTGSNIYLGTALYHYGAKSMQFDYNNNDSPYCSQVYRTYNPPNDWTQNGVKFLSLFFHGCMDNNAEQMYVILQDNNDVNAMVLYDGDDNDILQQSGQWWNIWNIWLRDFNDGGVNLACIKKITIGFGGSGSSGTVYFDDIRLSSYRCPPDYDYLPACDFTRDAMVNLADYAELANVWLTDSNDYVFDEIYDLHSDNAIDTADLAVLADDWLWPDEQVQVAVDACDIKGDISTMLTGVNFSYYYDNDALWADGSVAGYLRDINAGILRYPGGVETSKFHWQIPYNHWNVDLWDPLVDQNDYPPTDAYMDVNDYILRCREIGAEPLLGVNIQSGVRFARLADSVNEAADWVRYCNVTNDYNVVYWYMDNEPYYNSNCDGITVADYAYYVKQFVPAMKAVDPNIKILANWLNRPNEPKYWAEWEYLLEEAGQYIDIAEIHWYWDNGLTDWDNWLAENPMRSRLWCPDCYNDYSPSDARYLGPSYTDEIRNWYREINDINGVSYDIELAAMEWNIGSNSQGQPSTFQAALMQAEMLGQFIEGGLHMATLWAFNWPSGDQQNRYFLDGATSKPREAVYEVFRMYSNALGQQLVSSQADKVYIPRVCALSRDENTLWLYLLNKSIDGRPINAVVDINGFTPVKAEATALTAVDISSNIGKLQKLNVWANPETGRWLSVLPPYSLTMLTFRK